MAFIPFNLYESWARKVLVDNKAVNQGHTIHYTPLMATRVFVLPTTNACIW
jgi:hypothetical protein